MTFVDSQILPSQPAEATLGIDYELGLFKVGRTTSPPVLSSFSEQKYFLDAIHNWEGDPKLKSKAQYLGQLCNNFDIAWDDIAETINNGAIGRAPSALVEEFASKYEATPVKYVAKRADLASRLFITTQLTTIRSADQFDQAQAELMSCRNGNGANSLFIRFKVRLLQAGIRNFVNEQTVVDMDEVISSIPEEIQKTNGWGGNLPGVFLPSLADAKVAAKIAYEPIEKKPAKRSSIKIVGAPIERSFTPSFLSRPGELRQLENPDEWNEFSQAYSDAIEIPANKLSIVDRDTINLNGIELRLQPDEVRVLNMLMLSYGSNAFSFVQARQHHGYSFPSSQTERLQTEKIVHRTLLRFRDLGLAGYNDPENHRGIFLMPTTII